MFPTASVRQRAVLASLATRVRLNDEHRIGMAIVSRRLRRSSSATEPTQRAVSGESSARRVQAGVSSRHGEGRLEALVGCRQVDGLENRAVCVHGHRGPG